MSVDSYTLANGDVRWLFVIDQPRKKGEERKQIKRRGFIDAKTAQRAEAAERKRIAKFAPTANGTVAAELRKWVETRKSDLAPSSWEDYRQRFEAYVIPHIGSMSLVKAATPSVITGLHETLKERGGRRGQGLAASSVLGIHTSLMVALRDLGLDVSGIRSPRSAGKRGKRRRSATKRGRRGVWTDEQCRAFLQAIKDEALYVLYLLAIASGMRRGELCGLRWRHVDLDNGIIHVLRQRVAVAGVPGGVYEDEPKHGSHRDIFIDDAVVAALKRQRERCDRLRDRLGDAYQGEDFVFTSPRHGRPYFPDYVSHRFVELARRANLPRIALHDCRHTYATISGAAGVDLKALQDAMGHAQAETLTDIYMHSVEASKRAAAGTVGQILFPE